MEFILYLFGTIILGVIGSILGNLLTPYTRKIFKLSEKENKSGKETVEEQPEAITEEESDEKEHIRIKNRERFIAISQLIFLYGYTFFVLYISIYSPIGFGLFGDNIFLLSETRLFWLCDKCAFTTENQTHIAAITAIALYYPVWLLAQKLAIVIEKMLDHLTKLTSTQYTALLVGVFFLISVFIAGNWVYLLYPKFTYLKSIGIPFFVVIMGVLIIVSNKNKR